MRPDVVADVATIVSDCATQPDAATHSVTALHMITCEYPPQLGGVADFTRTIADRVAQTGREVHVWAPGTTGTVVEASGVIVHREFGSFSVRDRKRVASLLDETARDRTLFLQWVPHGFGARAMNVGFCLWLRDRVRHHDERLDLMVHEPFLPFRADVSDEQRSSRWVFQEVVSILSPAEISPHCRLGFCGVPSCLRLGWVHPASKCWAYSTRTGPILAERG